MLSIRIYLQLLMFVPLSEHHYHDFSHGPTRGRTGTSRDKRKTVSGRRWLKGGPLDLQH